MADAEEAHAARAEDALPVEARGAAPAVVADVEIGNLVFEVGGFAEAQPNLVDARDVDHPEAIAGREIVDGLAVERYNDRHPAKPHVVGEQIEEAAARRHDPRSLPRVDRPFEDGAGAGKAERGPPAELLPVALALGHLQHARRAVDVGRRVAAGEEGHVLQELGVEQADGAAGRRKVRERVDVGNLDVVHHEQVLERAAAADDDVVAEVVGADDDAGQGLHVARHVLQGRGALEDLARPHQEARVLHLFRRLEGGGGDGDGLLEAFDPGQRDFHGAVQTGAHVHRIAGERQARAAAGSPGGTSPHAARRCERRPGRRWWHTRRCPGRTRARPPPAWPAALTTTPLMAPTPVVSCARADVETRLRTVAAITTDTRERASHNHLATSHGNHRTRPPRRTSSCWYAW